MGCQEGRKRKRDAEPAPGAGAWHITGATVSRHPLPPHQLVLAPMVGGSELPFRLLARRHGAQLAYTPMMHADRFVSSPQYRAAELQTLGVDQPLVAHFAGNDTATLLAAARLAEPHCAAVDLNLGCPQRAAHSGRFGAFCRRPSDNGDDMDTVLVLEMVSALSRSLRVPVFCKIRLFDDFAATLRFCQQLEAAGCALLAVHGRYRGSPQHRRDGAAHLHQVADIKRALTIPVLTNGNVASPADLLASLELTGADGVMSAEGALDDPAIFGRAVALARSRSRELKAAAKAAKRLRASGRALNAEEQAAVAARREMKRKRRDIPIFDVPDEAVRAAPSALDLADEYLKLAAQHPPKLKTVVFHLRRMARDPLRQFAMRERLESLSLGAHVSERARESAITPAALTSAGELLCELRDYAEGRRAFVPAEGGAQAAAPAPEAAAAQAARAAGRVAEAAARAKRAAAATQTDDAAAACAAKRANFVQMQRKKARRQGQEPTPHLPNSLTQPHTNLNQQAAGRPLFEAGA